MQTPWKKLFQCPACRRPHRGKHIFCVPCVQHVLHLSRKACGPHPSALFYVHPVPVLLEEWRRNPSRGILKIFLHILKRSKIFQEKIIHIDAIAYVPSRERPWWQIQIPPMEILTEEIARSYGKLALHGLFQKKMEHAQHGRSARNRLDVPLFIAINAQMDHLFAGKKILLLDDVCTTGTSLEQCSLWLENLGAKKVEVFTLARAETRKSSPPILQNGRPWERTNPQPDTDWKT